MNHVLLAFSGGLDTSVAIPLIAETHNATVSTLTADVGQQDDLHAVQQKALTLGAKHAILLDLKAEFSRDFIFPALKANACYEGAYPLATALARPLIAKHLVDQAHHIGADTIAHGCTGKGNDQVRFEAAIAALDPDLQVIAPIRDMQLQRDAEISYAKEHNIPISQEAAIYSTDENIWGRSCECGPLEDPNVEPPDDCYAWTTSPLAAPATPQYISITFQEGAPVAIDNTRLNPSLLIQRLNQIGGEHGVGRIDHIESRLIGIKSRETYEAPAATILLHAHKDLEKLVLSKDLLHYKALIEAKYAELVYNGLWFHPLRDALHAFINSTQSVVSGTVKIKLYKGSAHVVGRTSPCGLYQAKLATYTGDDTFKHESAKGFIDIWSLPLRAEAARGGKMNHHHGQLHAHQHAACTPVCAQKNDTPS